MTETRVCWHCETTVGMIYEADYRRDVSTELPFEYFLHVYLWSCPVCDMPSVATRGDDDAEAELMSTGVRGKEYDDVPSHIAAPASEAHMCTSAGAHRSAILMARAVVEATCKEKGITSGDLYKKIDALRDAGLINEQVHAEATEIRHLGNDMAHGDFNQDVTKPDAGDILGFMDEVLEEVFQRPARLARRKALRTASVATGTK